MRYKVGDRVKIRAWDDLVKAIDRPMSCNLHHEMYKLSGTIATILEVTNSHYRLKEAGWIAIWTDDMVEGRVDMTKSDLKSGMIVERIGWQRKN